MHRFTLQAVILFTLLTLPSAVLANATPITYNILNNPDLQNGWTLSGTITTDGTIGTIQANDILSWTWTITKGASSFTLSAGDWGAFTWPNGITATGSGQLVLQPYSLIGLASPFEGIAWETDAPGTTLAMGWQGYGMSSWWSTMGTLDPGSSAWVIASTSAVAVPEPSPLYIAGLGAVFGSVYVMGHKRRARRTATTGA